MMPRCLKLASNGLQFLATRSTERRGGGGKWENKLKYRIERPFFVAKIKNQCCDCVVVKFGC